MTAATATDKAQKPELTNEQRNAIKAQFKTMEKEFGISAGDLFYQAAAYTFGNYLDLCSAAAKKQTGITDNKDATLVAKVSEISTACGLPDSTKRNIISPKDITDASVKLWQTYGEDIRGFFASLKK